MKSAGFGRLNADTVAAAGLAAVGTLLFNGTTADRQRNVAGADATAGAGVAAVSGFLRGTDANYRPTRSMENQADGNNGQNTPSAGLVAWGNSNAWRVRNNNTANLAATLQQAALMVANPGEWTELNVPAANTQAVASKAAGAGTAVHLCRTVSMQVANDAAAKTGVIRFNLRDGATGAGTIKRSWIILVPAGSSFSITENSLNIFGTAATAMTLESAAAGGADVYLAVSISGYTSAAA